MHDEVVDDVILSCLVSHSTPVDGRVVYRCHGDLQVTSVERDPDVRVGVERKAGTVAEPDEPRRRNSTCETIECLRLTGNHDRRNVFVRLVNSRRNCAKLDAWQSPALLHEPALRAVLPP